MNDTELFALAILVQRETFQFDSENAMRELMGHTLAYDADNSYTPAQMALEAELKKRNIINN